MVTPAIIKSHGNDDKTKLLLHYEGTINDSSFTQKTVNAVTPYFETTTKKFGEQSGGYVSGRLLWCASNDFQFGSDDFTIDFHFALSTVSGTHDVVGIKAADANFSVYMFMSGSSLYCRMWDSVTYNDIIIPSWNTGVWYHVALVRSGSSVKFYRDGILCGTWTTSNPMKNLTTPTLRVGRVDTSVLIFDLIGYVDELRVSSVARWTENFKPPTNQYY